jgi:hypothetical protein
MPIFHCPTCNHKSFTEKDEKEHAKTHQKPVQKIEPEIKKPEEKTKFTIPRFFPRFLDKVVSIVLINSTVITGKITGFNDYEVMLDEKVLIPKHSILTLQEVETKP